MTDAPFRFVYISKKEESLFMNNTFVLLYSVTILNY